MLVSGLAAVGPMIGEAQPHGVLPKNDAVWGCTDITNPGCMGPKVAEKGAFILRKKDAYFAPPQDWRHPVAQNDRREKIAGFVIAIAIARGLLAVLPLLCTAALLWTIVAMLDGFAPLPIPGLGFLVFCVFITLVGMLGGTRRGRGIGLALDHLIEKIPVVKVVYTAIKDLLNALVGDRKSFDQPIVVDLVPDGSIRTLGFVTCEQFDDPVLTGFVAVYLPQSYNFAGNLILVPRQRVHFIDADAGAFMAFIVSGGVAEMSATRTTIMDLSAFRSR